MRGGKRPGAGRPTGVSNKKTKLIAEQALKDGNTPLEVILQIMREAWATKDIPVALDAAKSAAPYIHPRLQPVDHNGSDTQKHQLIISWMTEAEAKRRGWA